MQKVVTQFQETDLSPVMRLVELGGGCWYFNHAEGSHTLVIGVGTAAFDELGGEDPNLARPTSRPSRASCPARSSSTTGTSRKSRPSPPRRRPRNAPSAASELAFNEYLVGQGGEETRIPLDKVAARRLEAAEWEASVICATSDSPRFSPGLKFAASDATPKINGATPAGLTVAGVRHAASDMTFVVGGSYASYRNEVMLVPDTLPLTAPPRSPKPRIYGLHLAIRSGRARVRPATIR